MLFLVLCNFRALYLLPSYRSQRANEEDQTHVGVGVNQMCESNVSLMEYIQNMTPWCRSLRVNNYTSYCDKSLKRREPVQETPPAGGRPGRASPPNSRIGPWFRLLKATAAANKLLPEFEVTLEATHHGPWTESPAMFVEIGSTEEYWNRGDAAATVASVFSQGLGLENGGGGLGLGFWDEETHRGQKVLLGIGGGHYAPRHGDVVVKDGVWVGHLLSGYSLLMTDPGSNVKDFGKIGGTWKEAILEAVNASKLAFPGGEIVAHLDGKSFKAWQRNAITWFLEKENIKIGKPSDFFTTGS